VEKLCLKKIVIIIFSGLRKEIVAMKACSDKCAKKISQKLKGLSILCYFLKFLVKNALFNDILFSDYLAIVESQNLESDHPKEDEDFRELCSHLMHALHVCVPIIKDYECSQQFFWHEIEDGMKIRLILNIYNALHGGNHILY